MHFVDIERWLKWLKVRRRTPKSVRATDHRGAPVELIVEEPHKNNPEEDGYWISEDGMLAEVHFNWDYDPDHNDWIREARKSPEQDTPDQD